MEDSFTRENFISLSALEKLSGNFEALGFLWVLREILGGKSEGVINLHSLAESIGVNIRDIYGFIGQLEDSFIIATRAESEGRLVKILIAPPVHEASSFSQECSDFIAYYLRKHNVIPSVSSHMYEDNTILINTALHMGNDFPVIKDFYSAVKSTLNDRREFEYSLNDANIPLADNGRIVSFANSLKNAGFLSSYSYKKSPHRIITAQVAQTSEAHQFISGGWLEIWTYCRAIQILTGSYACVRNLHVMLPNNEPSEFDMMICTRGNIFWIESKTARYSAYIPKYSRVAETLGLSPANAILVSPDAPSCEIQQGITCCNLEGFPQVFSESLNACS